MSTTTYYKVYSTISNTSTSTSWDSMYSTDKIDSASKEYYAQIQGYTQMTTKTNKIKEETMKSPQTPQEMSRTNWLKALLQSKRVLESHGHVVIVYGGEFLNAKQIIDDSYFNALCRANFRIDGVSTVEQLQGYNPNTQGLIVSLHTVSDVEDNFMRRSSHIHSMLWMLVQENRKSVAALWEEKIDAPTLTQLAHFAGGKNIEILECELPGVMLLISPTE